MNINPKNYKSSKNKEILNIYDRFPYNPDLKKQARELRNNQTLHEKILWYEFLSKLPEQFNRQKIVENYIVDFYCAKYKLAIEIDGNSHFDPKQEVYDKERTEKLESYGLKIIRFTNSDIENDFDNVCKKIKENLK